MKRNLDEAARGGVHWCCCASWPRCRSPSERLARAAALPPKRLPPARPTDKLVPIATCNQNAANAIFTSGTFTASGQFADSGIVQTTLLTGAAIDGVAPNQVGGTISYLGARANAFIDFTGQLKCDSATSGRVTSVVGTLRYYVTTSHGASAYKLSASRGFQLTLNFANASMNSTIAGAASVGD